jgi:hypothetical protein
LILGEEARYITYRSVRLAFGYWVMAVDENQVFDQCHLNVDAPSSLQRSVNQKSASMGN